MLPKRRIDTSVQVKKNPMKNIHFCASWLKSFFSNSVQCYLPKEYTPMCECLSFFSRKNIYLCTSGLKWYFYTWKYFSLEECTPLCECLIEEHLPLLELSKLVFSALENAFYLKNIHHFTFFWILKILQEMAKLWAFKVDQCFPKIFDASKDAMSPSYIFYCILFYSTASHSFSQLRTASYSSLSVLFSSDMVFKVTTCLWKFIL